MVCVIILLQSVPIGARALTQSGCGINRLRRMQVQVTDLGGISVETLQKASDGRFDGTITAFPDDNAGIPLPPNAPMYKRKARVFLSCC